MLDVIKQLLDKDLVTEESRAEIQEAWDQKISEVKEEAKVEVREEFAKLGVWLGKIFSIESVAASPTLLEKRSSGACY